MTTGDKHEMFSLALQQSCGLDLSRSGDGGLGTVLTKKSSRAETSLTATLRGQPMQTHTQTDLLVDCADVLFLSPDKDKAHRA